MEPYVNMSTTHVLDAADKRYAIGVAEGLISSIVKHGQCVLLKPNIVSRENYPTTTDPDVLFSVARMLIKKGCEIVVVDGPAPDEYRSMGKSLSEKRRKDLATTINMAFRYGHTDEYASYLPTEIEKAVLEYSCWLLSTHVLQDAVRPLGLRLMDIHEFGFHEMSLKLGDTGEEKLIRIMDCDQFDIIVNLPVLKMHSTCGISGAAKNLYGLLDPFSKMLCHRNRCVPAIVARLPELVAPPVVTILDAFMVPDAQESRWKEKRRIYRVAKLLCGESPIAIDQDATKLLQEYGLYGHKGASRS